jgi:hypothetical protein
VRTSSLTSALMMGAAPATDTAGNVYLAVGNGGWNGSTSGRTTKFGESVVVVKIQKNLGLLKAIDYYTPNDFGALNNGGPKVCSTNVPSGSCPNQNVLDLNGTNDIDLGSGGVTLISPVGVTNACGSNQELVAGGKEGVVYGICYSTQFSRAQTLMGGLDGCGYACGSSGSSNQTNTACSQSSAPGSGNIAQCFEGVNVGEKSDGTGSILSAPGIHGAQAFWAGQSVAPYQNYLYVAGAGTNSSTTPMVAYKILSTGLFDPNGAPETTPPTYYWPGPVPAVSWDGSNPGSGLVWTINAGGRYGHWLRNATPPPAFVSTAAQPAILVAYQAVPNPQTITLTELWESSTISSDYGPGAVKFIVPTIANGLVFGLDDFVLKVGLEPLFSAPSLEAATVPVGHRPIVHKPPDTVPPVPETYALVRFAAALARLVPGSDTESEFCLPSAASSCNRGRDALWDLLGRGSLLYRISWCARRPIPCASVKVETKLRPVHVRTKVHPQEFSWIHPNDIICRRNNTKKNALRLSPFL